MADDREIPTRGKVIAGAGVPVGRSVTRRRLLGWTAATGSLVLGAGVFSP